MGKFNQVEFDSLAPYEQKQYEMDNPRERTKRGEGWEARHDRFMANVSEKDTTKIQENLEKYRAKVGSDAGGKTISGGGGGGGAMPKSNRDITKNYKSGGRVSSASKRADGIAIRGRTRA